ncbi:MULTISPECIES: LysR family transcriptional regulator [Rhodopseudomonas]|uniref:LysR family transcriptional regulator n=1 Tax=Rhodopseudomonas TaxID=1073 RepID=UPI000A4A3C36|nr:MULTISPECIES: LysR family transcriptional regulator [Rhodopseudomonas]MDF3813401.1 LysR family transcriptional regulator [Rhodopseudomonas sp. BAL398]WOK15616.1 LysR family transcriptional regulator [Rhodopseudomonas sp. BAL398]
MNAVFETGSFAAAAKSLGVAQPSVAQLVRDLEAAFGVSLFDRHGQSLVATQLCRQLYASTSRIQAMEADAIAILQQREELAGGELLVGLGNAMPGMALISSFKSLYPKIQVRIEIGNWSDIVGAVVDRRVDVAVLPDVPQDRRFRSEVCLSQRVVAICHPKHPLNRREPVSIAKLMKYPLVFRTRHSSTQRVVDKTFRSLGLQPEPAIVVNTREGMLEAVANQLGVGFIWEHGSSRADRIARIVVTEMDVELPEYIFSLLGTKGRLVELFFQARNLSP